MIPMSRAPLVLAALLLAGTPILAQAPASQPAPRSAGLRLCRGKEKDICIRLDGAKAAKAIKRSSGQAIERSSG